LTDQYLFSYGTLQTPLVQMANFGRLLTGFPDVLVGYYQYHLEITDPNVVSQSGQSQHPILRYSGDIHDRVSGIAFAVNEFDLSRADRYEVVDYERIGVTLLSGTEAFVYVERVSQNEA
jgi:hypothetical protein